MCVQCDKTACRIDCRPAAAATTIVATIAWTKRKPIKSVRSFNRIFISIKIIVIESCKECATKWKITLFEPQRRLDHLTGVVCVFLFFFFSSFRLVASSFWSMCKSVQLFALSLRRYVLRFALSKSIVVAHFSWLSLLSHTYCRACEITEVFDMARVSIWWTRYDRVEEQKRNGRQQRLRPQFDKHAKYAIVCNCIGMAQRKSSSCSTYIEVYFHVAWAEQKDALHGPEPREREKEATAQSIVDRRSDTDKQNATREQTVVQRTQPFGMGLCNLFSCISQSSLHHPKSSFDRATVLHRCAVHTYTYMYKE